MSKGCWREKKREKIMGARERGIAIIESDSMMLA